MGKRRAHWSPEQDRVLRELWGKEKRSHISARVGKPPLAVSSRARELGLDKPQLVATTSDEELPQCVVVAAGALGALTVQGTAEQPETAAVQTAVQRYKMGRAAAMYVRVSEAEIGALCQRNKEERKRRAAERARKLPA